MVSGKDDEVVVTGDRRDPVELAQRVVQIGREQDAHEGRRLAPRQSPRCSVATRFGTTIRHASTTSSRISMASTACIRSSTQL